MKLRETEALQELAEVRVSAKIIPGRITFQTQQLQSAGVVAAAGTLNYIP